MAREVVHVLCSLVPRLPPARAVVKYTSPHALGGAWEQSYTYMYYVPRAHKYRLCQYAYCNHWDVTSFPGHRPAFFCSRVGEPG